MSLKKWMFSILTFITLPVYAAEVTVYKSPTCSCCKKWVSHLRDNGFDVVAKDVGNVNRIKSQLGIEPKLASCHTAIVDGYLVEGHVPAADIMRMLKQKPDIKGLTAPGMPMGSPGMEGNRKDKYEVLAIGHDGKTKTYAKH